MCSDKQCSDKRLRSSIVGEWKIPDVIAVLLPYLSQSS